MDFFEFLFGNKKDDDNASSSLRDDGAGSSISEKRPQGSFSGSSMDPVEQYVKESVADLKKHQELSTKALEAEAIYLAAFLYLKDTYQIDFELDYLSDGLLDKIRSGNFNVADKIFSYMIKYGEGFYGQEEQDYGVGGYKMNIQLCSDYGSYIKTYFMRSHKIGSEKNYNIFSSPRNSLCKNGEAVMDSPTQRDIYYKYDEHSFELMIPPYNPLVVGRVKIIDSSTLRGDSKDGKRTFFFHFAGSINPSNLQYIDMYRNDKGDVIRYHKA